MPKISCISLTVLMVFLAFCTQSTAFTRHLPSLFKDFQDYLKLSQAFFQSNSQLRPIQTNVPDVDAEIKTGGGYLRKIVAVGDLHGDMPNALKVLQMAHVVDANGDWSGEIDFFVQTGDIIDRGDDTILLYDFMEKLRVQAHHAGGEVLSHLGNHEWMNVIGKTVRLIENFHDSCNGFIGDWRYVYPTEIETFGSVSARQKNIASGPIGRAWAQNYTTAGRLPLHPSLGPSNTDFPPSSSLSDSERQRILGSPLSHAALSFVHGGLAPTYPHLQPYPSAINTIAASLLHKLQTQSPLPPPYPPNPYPGLPDATPEEVKLYESDGPLWFRGWALESEQQVCKDVDGVLEQTGVRRMVMGHTPDFERIVSRCGGKIIIIDTGICHAYGGVLSALSIEYSLTPVGGSEETGGREWEEREIVKAIYEDKEEVLVYDERKVTGDFTTV